MPNLPPSTGRAQAIAALDEFAALVCIGPRPHELYAIVSAYLSALPPAEAPMAERKTEIVWGIRRDGRLLPHFVAARRMSATFKLRQSYRTGEFDIKPLPTWSDLRKQGFTVHKLEVRDAQ